MNASKIHRKFNHLLTTLATDDSTGETNTLAELARKREAAYKHFEVRLAVEPLINTALAINWNFEKMAKPRIDRFLKEFPQITSIRQLYELIKSLPARDFALKYLNIYISGPGNPKYRLLLNLCEGFLDYQKQCGIANEIEMMKHWASQVNIARLKTDPIGKLWGVGPGVVQNS